MPEHEHCLLCGEPCEHQHHLTGRGADHEHLDPALTVPLCHNDHELVHQDLRTDEIDRPLTSATVPERIERRLERVATFLGRAYEFFPFMWLGCAAAAVRSWATELGQFIAALDQWNTGWRGAT